MAFEPMTQIIKEIGDWGAKDGPSIIKAFEKEGAWGDWAQVEMALYFDTFENVEVSRAKDVDNSSDSTKTRVDLLMQVDGGKNIAMRLICETKPSDPDAIGDPEAWREIAEAYEELKKVDKSKYRPVAMGIMVSSHAINNAEYNLCDRSLFDSIQLYKDKSGNVAQLFFHWL